MQILYYALFLMHLIVRDLTNPSTLLFPIGHLIQILLCCVSLRTGCPDFRGARVISRAEVREATGYNLKYSFYRKIQAEMEFVKILGIFGNRPKSQYMES